MTVDLTRSQEAIHSFLDPKAAKVDEKGREKRLVIRGDDKERYIAYVPLEAGEKALRFLGTGDANFKNVVQFALENNVIEGLAASDKEALLERSFKYNQGHNWLRSFMRVNITQLIQKAFGKEKPQDVNEVISQVQQKVLAEERLQKRVKDVSALGAGSGIIQLMGEDNMKAAKILLSKAQPNDPQHKDSFTGKILLHEAIKQGDVELVKGLIAGKKIDTFVKDSQGRTALHLAVEKGNEEMVKALLECNPEGINDQDNYGNTVLHDAIRKKQANIALVLAASPKLNLGVADPRGQTPLHAAASSPIKGLMPALLAHNPSNEVLAKKDADKQTALEYAALQNEEAALALLKVVSDEVCKEARVSYEFRPKVYIAVKAREKAPLQDEMRLVIPGGSLNDRQLTIMKGLIQDHNVHQFERDAEGRAPLHRAVDTGSMQVIDLLLGSKDPLLNLRDKKGRTALHIAIESGKDDIAMRLLQDDRQLLNVEDEQGNTPLQVAILRGNLNIARKILEGKKFQINHPNKEGQTALMLAVRSINATPDLEFVKQLLQIEGIKLTAQDQNGNIALRYGVYFGRTEEETNDRKKIFALLLDATMKQDATVINLQNKEGMTLLHHAMQLRDVDFVNSLLKFENIDVNLKTFRGKTTPLHIAAVYGSDDLVRLLLDSGKVKIDEHNNDGETAYDVANRSRLGEEILARLKPTSE